MRHHVLTRIGLTSLFAGMLAIGGPVQRGARQDFAQPTPKLSPDRFRCILVGDSQTTDPSSTRIRTQNHRWDAPVVGELVAVGSSATGFVVNNSNAGQKDIIYQTVDLNVGWPNGGPNDFFALHGANWTLLADINAPGSRIGRYRLRFGGSNTDAPWDIAWGIGQPLVAKIAVRTSPMSVGAIQTRAERGGVNSADARIVHQLNKQWGVQIIEQPIPNDFNPMGDDVGVGFYLPSGSIEKAGQVFQVLGVVIERVGPAGQELNGTLVGYQGRGGWNIQDHLDLISPASRAALIEIVNPEYLMIILGHNQEPGGLVNIEPNLKALVDKWETSFAMLGRRRPTVIYVTPWAIFSETASDYLLEAEMVMARMANDQRADLALSYLQLFNNMRPDLYDPSMYQLDGANVHPGDIPSAVNLSQDLFELLFK